MFFLGGQDEVEFLVNFYVRRSVKKNVPLKDIQTLLKNDDKPVQDTVEKDLLKAESETRLQKLETAKLDSSCKSDELQFVELEPRKTKKRPFNEWFDGKKIGFCEVSYRLCCCCRNKTTVSCFPFSF